MISTSTPEFTALDILVIQTGIIIVASLMVMLPLAAVAMWWARDGDQPPRWLHVALAATVIPMALMLISVLYAGAWQIVSGAWL